MVRFASKLYNWVALMIVVGIPAVKSYASLGAAATMLASGGIAVAIKIAVFAREAHRRLPRSGTVPPNCCMASSPVAASPSGIPRRSI